MTITTRFALAALAALTLAPATASAQDVVPLAGQGENIQPIARVLIPQATEVEVAGDWAFVATDKGEEGEGGLVIVNIADPTKPFIEGRWTGEMGDLRDASFGDVDLSPDANLAVITNAHCTTCSEGNVAWAALLDVTDKAHPKMVGKVVDDGTMDYVHTATLDNKLLYLNPQVWAGYTQPGNGHITVFDISDPANPVKKTTIDAPGSELGFAHDTFIDHRPDGKTLLYAASAKTSDVIDISDPLNASWLQSATSAYEFSHDVQPNHDRTILVVDDEATSGGQLAEEVSICGKVGSGPASLDFGSVHFFQAAEDGTFANGGLLHLGSFNAPTNVNTGACVAHVFWLAPNENRLTQAYYRTGAFVVDFENPAAAKTLGFFVADGGANYWSNKPHRGYMFATDQDHGLDILRYTGEGGTRWPTTSGPAEIQRSQRQGVPYVAIAGVKSGSLPKPTAATPRTLGRFAFTARVKRVPGKSGKRVSLVLTFTNAKGKRVGRLTVRRTAGRKATVKVTGVAVAARYRWTLKAGKRSVARGRVTAKRASGLSLSPGATLAARAK